MDNESKTWSNTRGYGKVNIYEFNKDNINMMTFDWNRIDNLKTPYYTNADTNMAWTNKDINSLKYSNYNQTK